MSDQQTESRPQVSNSSPLPVSVTVSVSDDAGHNDVSRVDAHAQEKKTDEAKPEEKKAVDTKQAEVKASPVKVQLQKRLPALDDDSAVGVQKEHIVTRDGEPDLRFRGVLLASAAPESAPKGSWQEYRIYQTTGDKHVFSKVTRTVKEAEDDTYEAEVFDPSPPSVSSQILRSARELARSRPVTWMDAAVSFFGYDPLAKALYRKLSVRFEEQIS